MIAVIVLGAVAMVAGTILNADGYSDHHANKSAAGIAFAIGGAVLIGLAVGSHL